MLHSFYAKLPSVLRDLKSTEDLGNNKHATIFRFTKNKMWLTNKNRNEKLSLDANQHYLFDGMVYTIEKVYDTADKRRWRVTFPNSNNMGSYAELGAFNSFKCNVIHNRYWLLNETKWFATFVISILALLIALYTLYAKVICGK